MSAERPQAGLSQVRWKALVGLAALAGLVVAAVTFSFDDIEEQLRDPGRLAAALALQLVALSCGARAWSALFPPGSDRRALHRGLYTSQLTKYLPIGGGLVQTASQVALAAGLHVSRIDGSPIVYNGRDPWLPDFIVCRKEWAQPVLSALWDE